MKAVWVDEGNDCDYGTITKHGIKWLFYALTERDPRVTSEYLQQQVNRNYQVGVYTAWNWSEFAGTGTEYAQKTFNLLKKRVPNLKPSFPKVQLNMELHDPQYVIDMVVQWRKLAPNQDTSWTFEGHQAGWMSDNMVKAVKDAKIRLVPQLYSGDMSRVYDSLAECRSLVKRGFPEASVSPFYDAAQLPEWWDGFAFTMGRLPR